MGAVDRLLRQIKGYLWNGNLHDGRRVIEEMVMDLECVETDYPSIKALRKAAGEFEVYIRNNVWMIPNYAERRRYGERVSTGFVESAINTEEAERGRDEEAQARREAEGRLEQIEGRLREEQAARQALEAELRDLRQREG